MVQATADFESAELRRIANAQAIDGVPFADLKLER